jgi:hypothetical protein
MKAILKKKVKEMKSFGVVVNYLITVHFTLIIQIEET